MSSDESDLLLLKCTVYSSYRIISTNCLYSVGDELSVVDCTLLTLLQRGSLADLLVGIVSQGRDELMKRVEPVFDVTSALVFS